MAKRMAGEAQCTKEPVVAISGDVAVVGATGVVGGEILELLAERGHPDDHVRAFASERSAGTEAEYGEETLEVERFDAEALRGVSTVFIATPSDVAKEIAARAQAQGAWALDASVAFRSDVNVPLAVPGRPVAAPAKGRVVRCAAPASAALISALEPLREPFGIASVNVTALLGAGAAGTAGVAELERETVDLMSGREPEPKVFPHRLAFNVVPQVGAFDAEGASAEETAWARELALLWQGAPRFAATACQVPGFFGHLLVLEVELSRSANAAEIREHLGRAAPDVKVLDTPAEGIYPMPMLVASDTAVHVGRIRSRPGQAPGFTCVMAFEGARRAALALVDAAESLNRLAH
jgi:aspartate-semialdehyde dehydrogenase